MKDSLRLPSFFVRLPKHETVNAHAHLRTLRAVKCTAENLKSPIEAKTHEFKKMYPAMI